MYGQNYGMGMGPGLGSGFGQQGIQSAYGQPGMGMQSMYRQPIQSGFGGQMGGWGQSTPMGNAAQQQLMSHFNTFHNNAMSDWTQSRPDYYQQQGFGQFQPQFQSQFQGQTPYFGQHQIPYQTQYTSPWQSQMGQMNQYGMGQFGQAGIGQSGMGQSGMGQSGIGQMGQSGFGQGGFQGQFGSTQMGFSPFSTPLASQATSTLQNNVGSYRTTAMNDWSLSRPENQQELATAAMYSQAYGQGALAQGGMGQTTGQSFGQGFGQGLGQGGGQTFGQGQGFGSSR